MTAEDKRPTIFVTEKMVCDLNEQIFDFAVHAQRGAITRTVKMAVDILEELYEKHSRGTPCGLKR